MHDRAPRLLHTLERGQLTAAAANRRWPKWSTMCQLRLLGNPVLNGICVTPDADAAELQQAIAALSKAASASRLMVRSDGGIETTAYYRGGNSYPISQVEPHATELLATGRAVILLEPTNRFTNQLSVLLRMDRPAPGQPGTFTIEALGPGYDVSDLTRGGIRPQVTVTIPGTNWHAHEEPWWADLRVTQSMSLVAERTRRQARLHRLANHIRAATGDVGSEQEDQVAIAEEWLRSNGYLDLWRGADPTMRVVRHATTWFDAAFLISATHPNRRWRCLATSLSDLGGGRLVYWDIVDGAHKYATAPR